MSVPCVLALLPLLSIAMASQPTSFRAMTFNVLANEYAKVEWFFKDSATVKSKAPHFYWNHRFPLNVNLVKDSGADLLFLQEVDRYTSYPEGVKAFLPAGSDAPNGLWGNELQNLSYDSIFMGRTRHVPANEPPKPSTAPEEGLATAWKPRFSVIHHEKVEMPEATEHLTPTKMNVAIWTVLKDSVTGERIITGNTHLNHRNWGKTIRAHQISLLKSKAHELQHKFPSAPVIISGDFNMRPDEPGYAIMIRDESKVNSEAFWEDLKSHESTVKADGITKEIEKPSSADWDQIRKDCLQFIPAVDQLGQLDTVSHKTPNFQGLLDHMFTIPSLDGKKLVLQSKQVLPAIEDIGYYPDLTHGSDHLPRSAEFFIQSVDL